MKKRKLIVPAVILGIAAVALTVTITYFRNAAFPPVQRQLKYSFTIKNTTNRLVNKTRLLVYAPVDDHSFQKCAKLTADMAYTRLKTIQGNQVLEFEIENMVPYETRLLHIEAAVVQPSPDKKSVDQNRKQYLEPQPCIESDHPDIKKLARSLKGKTELETAKNIYSWVAENIQYSGYAKNSRGALYAFEKRKGDCTEYMCLFVALCRANHIPARGIGGYICASDSLISPSGYHNWAQFLIQKKWFLADCQKKKFMDHSGTYIAMKVISDDSENIMGKYRQFRIFGESVKVKMNH